MAKRGYKLQEFLAHPTNVNCLSIGKKTSRLLITGGDDHKVNLWAIGKPTSLMSLCGHASPVESVAFDSAEVLVAAGASTGVIKLWDLEEAKMVRALTGHRSNCTAVEFHPFGEFFASGSMDTNLKIWDIRKKGCIHTYKGHTRGISIIRFTPDGRWVVSGGLDNIVKVWDLTAGKLLHEFKFHEGHIRSIDFHPLEFLLATGSADGTVKFWDLESFELIGSSRPESSGVRAITFHPNGRTLFCGLDDGLKVYSWEPVISHDSVDMEWSTLGDLCINGGKLLGCSYYTNSVGVWVADISLIEPYGAGLTDKHECIEKRFTSLGSQSSERMASSMSPASAVRNTSPDYETKEIKNIYIDSLGRNSTAAQKVLLPLDSEKVRNVTSEKQNAKSAGQAVKKSFAVPSIVPWDGDVGKESSDSGRESITFSRTKPGMLLRPAQMRKTPTKFDESKQPLSVQSGTQNDKKCESESEKDQDSQSGCRSEDRHRKPYDEEHSTIKSITDKFEKALSPEPPSNEINRMLLKPPRIRRSPNTKNKETTQSVSVDSGILNKRRGGLQNLSDQDLQGEFISEDRSRKPCDGEVASIRSVTSKFERTPSPQAPDKEVKRVEPLNRSSESKSVKIVRGVTVVSGRTRSLVERFERRERFSGTEDKPVSVTINQPTNVATDASHVSPPQPANTIPTPVIPVMHDQATDMRKNRRFSGTEDKTVSVKINQPTNVIPDEPHVMPPRSVNTIPTEMQEPEISERESETDVTEDLMQNHDAFLSTLQSRLTKLQIVRHFWERKDIEGAIGALKKLPDHSVQADVVGVLMDKTKILTLDVFSSLLPVLTGLLHSKTERPANVALEMLLKLVAVFGPVIRSTVSGPRVVGVDLHAEQRLQLCNECFIGLQSIEQILPELAKRGGFLSKKAQELNLVLQEP